MRDRPEQVSGFKLDAAQEEADDDDSDAKAGVYTRFCEALEREVPDLLERARLTLRLALRTLEVRGGAGAPVLLSGGTWPVDVFYSRALV